MTVAYNNRDNVTDWYLTENGVVRADLSTITLVEFIIGGVKYDSTTLGNTVIWWTDNDGTNDILRMKFGQFGISAGCYKHCRLRVTDAANPNGVMWDDNITLDVRDEVVP